MGRLTYISLSKKIFSKFIAMKDSSLIGPFKPTPFLADGLGESAFLVTEELGVHEGLRNGRFRKVSKFYKRKF